MNDSWIAIADRSGLRQLVLETKPALQAASQRANQENVECFWAVLQPFHAEIALEQLRLGHAAEALSIVEHLSLYLGRISPHHTDISIPHSENVTIPDERDMDWNDR